MTCLNTDSNRNVLKSKETKKKDYYYYYLLLSVRALCSMSRNVSTESSKQTFVCCICVSYKCL